MCTAVMSFYYIYSIICFILFRGSENPNSTGQVKLTIGYSLEESRLFITVHACRSLYVALLASHFKPAAAASTDMV